MELYFLITIVDRRRGEDFRPILEGQDLTMALTMLGRGTATSEQLSLYGLEDTDKAVICTVAGAEQARQIMKSAKRRMFIDIPGNGIILALPVKSVGGGRTLAYLAGSAAPDGSTPSMSFDHELIIVIVNEGHTDQVMDAAREAGASGGTVLHAKGTGAKKAEKFLGVSLADEKEVILIVSASKGKAAIMGSIAKNTGPGTPAGAIAFTLPVSSVIGLRAEDEE